MAVIESLERCIELHTLHVDGGVQASDDLVTGYFDGIGMLICEENGHACRTLWNAWFHMRLVELGFPWPVGMGQSGAAILGMLGHGTLLRAPYKLHGLPVQGRPLADGMRVILVDDIAVTGSTFRVMRQELDRSRVNVNVIGEMACVDRRPGHGG